MLTRDKSGKLAHIIAAVILFTISFCFWGIQYPHHLMHKEQMQMFLTNSDYFWQHISYQGGTAIYLGEWLTQFFRFTWLAAAILSTLLVAIYISINQIIKHFYNVNFSVLALIPAIGYGLLLTNDFYYLSGAVALCISLWLIVIYAKIDSLVAKTVYGLFATVIIYWLLGAVYIPYVITIILIELYQKYITQLNQRQSVTAFITSLLALGVFLPLSTRYFLTINTIQQSFLSPAYYKFTIIFPKPLWLLLASLPLIFIAHWALKLFEKLSVWTNATLLIIICALTIYGYITIPNNAEEVEMKYSNLVNQQKWNDIIHQAELQKPEGKQARLALILALAQTRQLGERLFEFNPTPTDFFIPYEVHGMAPLISNEPYFYLGMINFAQMLSMESIDSSPDAVMPVRAVKRYAETCIITGQYAIAEKFLGYLKKTLFYKDWANEASTYLYNDAKVNEHAVWGSLRKKQIKDPFYFNLSQIDLAYAYLLRSDPRNQMAFDYLMASCLLQKDVNSFMKFLSLITPDSTLPRHYQETLAFIETITSDIPSTLKSVKISNQVRDQLKMYAQAFTSGGRNNPNSMKPLYGNTYWYYIHFYNADETANQIDKK